MLYNETEQKGEDMCTCMAFSGQGFYFGRNMDLEGHFGEKVAAVSAGYRFPFRHIGTERLRYGVAGMAVIADGCPLFADAVNEKGLCMAGLHFPGNAWYGKACRGKRNVASYELILWLLGNCADADEAVQNLLQLNITDDAFSDELKPAPLHWMLADSERCIVIEPEKENVKIYDNPFGVLTNNPPFYYHQINVVNYLNVTAEYPECRFPGKGGSDCFLPYSEGMGGIGLPGDYSSASRFVKTLFLKENCRSGQSREEEIGQFFHIMEAAAMPAGSVRTEEKGQDLTVYTSCVDVRRGIYYLKTRENSRICAADFGQVIQENTSGSGIKIFEPEKRQDIKWMNPVS